MLIPTSLIAGQCKAELTAYVNGVPFVESVFPIRLNLLTQRVSAFKRNNPIAYKEWLNHARAMHGIVPLQPCEEKGLCLWHR